MKKIIQIMPIITDGGAETVVKDYCLLLDKSKYEVIIFCIYINKKSANYHILVEKNIRIESVFGEISTIKRICNRLVGRKIISWKLKRIVKWEKPHVLHLHLAMMKYVFEAIKKYSNLKIVYTCHSLPEKLFAGNNAVEYKYAKKIMQKNKIWFIALHDSMRKELNDLFSIHDTIVLINGIDFDKYNMGTEDKDILRKKKKIPIDAFVVGHIGRFSDVKNHDFLVDVFFELYNNKKNAFLLLVGDGELKGIIEEKINRLNISDRVLILSNRTDVPELLKCMDVFVFPSKYEGLGIAFVEAQVSNLKCVISDTIPDECVIANDVTVLSLDAPISTWCKAIEDVPMDYKLIDAANEYNIKKSIQLLEEIYD